MDNFIIQEENNFKGLFNRLRKRNFSGNAGQAVKNSSYQLATNLVMKIGSLLFTIVVARMLLPELFGLYSLALSTILLFSAFSDLGFGKGILTFVSKAFGKGEPRKAKAYFKKLLKWKLGVVFGASALLLILSYFIANNYYGKPIFYALLAGVLYVPLVALSGLFELVFNSVNNFRKPLFKEIIFQVLRLILVPIVILLFLKNYSSKEMLIAGVILAIVFCYFVSYIFLLFSARKKVSFLKVKPSSLTKKETKSLKKFIFPLTATALSGVFFGYIDTLMLGRFVSESYIAFYGAAFSLVSSGSAMMSFVAKALFPLFSNLEGPSLENLFRRARKVLFFISVLGGVFTYLISNVAIRIAYGQEYLSAVPVLKWFSVLVIILPVIGLHSTYLMSQRKTKSLAVIIISTTLLNILLNFVGIKVGLSHGMFGAVLGVTFATIISRFVYLGGLIFFKKKN